MSETVERLLTEIKDLQREQLQTLERMDKSRREEVAKAAENQQRALRLQEDAVARQRAFGALYRRVLFVAALVVVIASIGFVYTSMR